MTKIQMTKTGDYDVLSAEFLSFENSGLNLFVSNFDIRYSDFKQLLLPRIGPTSPGPPPEVEGLITTK